MSEEQELLEAEALMPEAPASLNLRFASRHGFECQLTVRSFDAEKGGLTLLAKLEAVEQSLHKKGCKPIFGKNSQPAQQAAQQAEPKAETKAEEKPEKKPCPLHPGKFLKLRRNDEGGEWYSHKIGNEWCRGE